MYKRARAYHDLVGHEDGAGEGAGDAGEEVDGNDAVAAIVLLEGHHLQLRAEVEQQMDDAHVAAQSRITSAPGFFAVDDVLRGVRVRCVRCVQEHWGDESPGAVGICHVGRIFGAHVQQGLGRRSHHRIRRKIFDA